jgi:hypothetical protein
MEYRINTLYLGDATFFSVNSVRLIEGCWPVKISYVTLLRKVSRRFILKGWYNNSLDCFSANVHCSLILGEVERVGCNLFP